MEKICVIIPTYNEAKAIKRVVMTTREQGLDVLVIDDGSSDGTPVLAGSAGARVIVNEKNMGKGACLIKGFGEALRQGYDAVITMDGDGQHLPQEAAKFVKTAAAHLKCGIIVGNRMGQRGSMPFIRVATNKFMSWLISLVCRQEIPDTQCGYRLIRRKVLEQIKLSTAKYETESEMLIKASRLGYIICSIPVTSVYDGATSHINPITDTLRFFSFLFKNA